MIKSIQFKSGKYGYVNARVEKPERPSVRDIGPRPFSFRDPDKYKQLLDEWNRKKKEMMDDYERRLEEYNKVKGEYQNPYLAKCLIDKKFEFSENRINIIVGPNGCGKSTIIKAIAAYAGCGLDGFPSLIEPMALNYVISDAQTEADYDSQIEKSVTQAMKNPCKITWDGTPVYYHNFIGKTANAGNEFGMLKGGFISNAADEAFWHLEKDRMCGGEKTLYMLDSLLKTVREPVCYDELLRYDSGRTNDVWTNTYEAQRRFYAKFRNFSYKRPCTLLLDELDQNFDIATNIDLYGTYLPKVVDHTGIQIIAVSHSPVVFSDAIFSSMRYNIISIDNEYTALCRERLNKMFKYNEKDLKQVSI